MDKQTKKYLIIYLRLQDIVILVEYFMKSAAMKYCDPGEISYRIIGQISVFFIFSRLWDIGFPICTWELELICRVFVKSEVLGDVMVCVQIHLIVKEKLKASWCPAALAHHSFQNLCRCQQFLRHLRNATLVLLLTILEIKTGKIWTDSEDVWLWKVRLNLRSDLVLIRKMISASIVQLEMVILQLKAFPPPLRPRRGQQSAPGLLSACTESSHQKLFSLRSGSPLNRF